MSEHSQSRKWSQDLEGGSEGAEEKTAEMEVGLKKNLKGPADGKTGSEKEESKAGAISSGGKKTVLKSIDE